MTTVSFIAQPIAMHNWLLPSLKNTFICCIDPSQIIIIILLFRSLVDKTSDEKSPWNLGCVSKQAKREDHSAQFSSQEKHSSGILICLCWNEPQPCHAWMSSGTSSSHSGSDCSRHPCRQVLPSMQEVCMSLLENCEQYHIRHCWKILAVFFCPEMVVIAIDNHLLSTGYLVSVEHIAGEPRLLSAALEKPLSKLVLPGVVWTHCRNSCWWYVAAVADARLAKWLCEIHA